MTLIMADKHISRNFHKKESLTINEPEAMNTTGKIFTIQIQTLRRSGIIALLWVKLIKKMFQKKKFYISVKVFKHLL